jgi:hypothetical protein
MQVVANKERYILSAVNAIVTCIPIARQRLGKHVPGINTPQQ